MSHFFYMRISTQEERGMQKFDRQENSLMRYASENGLQFDEHNIYKEDRSGKSFEGRTEWAKLEASARENDTIVFKDISRFTRESEKGYEKYMTLFNRGINQQFYFACNWSPNLKCSGITIYR